MASQLQDTQAQLLASQVRLLSPDSVQDRKEKHTPSDDLRMI